MTREEFIQILDGEKSSDGKNVYQYDIDGDKLVIGYNGYLGNVHLYLESIPPNVVFKNIGSVYLNELKIIPPGVEFRNTDGVHLKSVRSLSPDVKFMNGGIVRLREIESLPPGVEFNNGDYVYLWELKSIPPGVLFNNEGYVMLNKITGDRFEDWKGNIEGVDSKRLLNFMISKGVFEK